MKEWRKELEELNFLKMILSRRGTGYTSTILAEFIGNSQAGLLVVNDADRNHVFSMLSRKVGNVFLLSEGLDRLRGFHGPLIIDNHTLEVIMQRYMNAVQGQSEEYNFNLMGLSMANNILEIEIRGLRNNAGKMDETIRTLKQTISNLETSQKDTVK